MGKSEGIVPTRPLTSANGQGSTLFFSGEDFSQSVSSETAASNGHGKPPGGEYLINLADRDPSFPACLNGRFQGLLARGNRGEAILFNDATALAEFTTTKQETRFILRQKPSRCLPFILSCGKLMHARWENLSPSDACSITGPSFGESAFCQRDRNGSSRTRRWWQKRPTLIRRNGKTRNH